jgi:hypothetical protein
MNADLRNSPDPDLFADFRACVNGASADSILRLMPIEKFARSSRARRTTYPPPEEAGPAAPDDVVGLMGGLKLPIYIADFEYPRQCRIRRVRVLAPADDTPIAVAGPVIVSKKMLGDIRETR